MDKTIQFYDDNSSDWAGARFTNKFWKESFGSFQRELPSGRILEIGCGAGRDAQTLIEMGYEYVGTDLSKSLLELAKNNNPGQKFALLDVFDLKTRNLGEKFDGFWCAAMLLHIEKARIAEALDSISSQLKPGAIGFVSVKEGDGERVEKQDEGERFYSYFRDDEFRKILDKSNFEVLKFQRQKHEKTMWLKYIIRYK